MSALDWYKQMKEAPKLVHDNGMVLVQLGEDVVLFPSDADARFFFEACTDVPNLVGQVVSLRGLVDEEALSTALARNIELVAEVGRLTRERDELSAQLGELAEKEALAARRVRTLALAVKHGIRITP